MRIEALDTIAAWILQKFQQRLSDISTTVQLRNMRP
jgi:hypothetical protein